MVFQIIFHFILGRYRHDVTLSLNPFPNFVDDICSELKNVIFLLNFSNLLAHLSFIKLAFLIPYQVFLHHKAFLIHWVEASVLSLRYETFVLEDTPHFLHVLFMSVLRGPYESVVAHVRLLKKKFKPWRVVIAENLGVSIRQFSFLLHFLTMFVSANGEEGRLAQQVPVVPISAIA